MLKKIYQGINGITVIIYVYVNVKIHKFILWYIYNYKYKFIYFYCFIMFHILSILPILNRQQSQCRGRIMEQNARGCRFKSPVWTMELCAIHVARTMFGNFPLFGICEISHKSYFSQEFSHQYMGNIQRKFNLYTRMKLLLNMNTC